MKTLFISYRRESPEHAKSVWKLALILRQSKIPVELDQLYLSGYPGGPDEGWPRWCEDRAVKSEAVLIIASRGWFAVYEGREAPGDGCGAAAEAALLRQYLYNEKGENSRIRLAFLDDLPKEHIPASLRAWQSYKPFASSGELDQLVAWATQRLELKDVEPPPVRLPAPSFALTGLPQSGENIHEELQKVGAVNDVFISCKNLTADGVQTRDAEIAAEVYDFLTGKGLSVFLSTLTLEELGASDYTSAIDSALKSASVLLAIGTSADHLESNWVKYEWNSFANAIRSGRKPNGRIFTYIEGMPITDLPWALQQTQTFVHGKGALQRLYNFINKALSPSWSPRPVIRHSAQTHGGRPAAPSLAERPTMSRKQVFISYSHKDKRWCDVLDTYLKPYLRDGSIKSWSDEQISPGSKWFNDIKSALADTKVAVLLVSPDFLASDFIHEHELGPLLKEAEQGGVRILWVPVRDSAYKQTPIRNYQAVLNPGKPLAGMTRARRDHAWVKICEEIEKAVNPLK